MSDQPVLPDGDDDLSYEDFDDVSWPEPVELEPIDLDALDDEIEPVTHDEPTAALLASIETLDDELPPAGDDEPAGAPSPGDEKAPSRLALKPLDLDVLDDEIEPADRGTLTKLFGSPAAEDTEVTEAVMHDIPVLDGAVPGDVAGETLPAGDEAPAAPIETDDKEEMGVSEFQPEQEPEPVAQLPAEAADNESADKESADEEPADVKSAAPPMVFCIQLDLSLELAERVRSLRQQNRISPALPSGIELVGTFRAGDVDAVKKILADWARNHLPIQLEITGVVADVIGAQRYVAAWSLQPEDTLQEARAALVADLEPLITLETEGEIGFRPWLAVSTRVPPQPFPRLIDQMQREYEPYVWDTETIVLLTASADDSEPGWETAISFR
ncbi:MAG: 2'-5' RNA ligase family protein [Anaerolineae bacterium]|nr:2'-5' RNA ligase family protein [Anaerolineae bacterium]